MHRSETAPAPDVDRVVAGFVHCLRSGGLTVPINMSMRFRQALELLGMRSGVDVYWAGRSTLVSRPEDTAMFNAMFLAFFHQDGTAFKVRFEDEAESASLATDDGESTRAPTPTTTMMVALRYSAAEVLGEKDFADFTKAELHEAERVMARMRLNPSTRVVASTGAAPLEAHDTTFAERFVRRCAPRVNRSRSRRPTEVNDPSPGVAARRERIDGGVCEGAHPFRPCGGRRSRSRRGLRTGDTVDPHDPPTRVPRCR